MDFGFAIEKMKQGERVFRKSYPSRAYGIARNGNDRIFAEFYRTGEMGGAYFVKDDILAEDWELFTGWKND